MLLCLCAGATSCSHWRPEPAAPIDAGGDARVSTSMSADGVPAKVDFATQIRPILEARCQPCHFSGGVMYQRRPFDRPATITALGTKLFSRIKAEDERRLIREFLAQQSEGRRDRP